MIDSVLKSLYVVWRALNWVFSLIRYLNWSGLWLGMDVRTLKDKYSKEIALQAQKLLSLLGSIFYIIGRTKMTILWAWESSLWQGMSCNKSQWKQWQRPQIEFINHLTLIAFFIVQVDADLKVSPRAHLPWHTNSNMNSPNTARFLILDHHIPKFGGGVINLGVSWPVQAVNYIHGDTSEMKRIANSADLGFTPSQFLTVVRIVMIGNPVEWQWSIQW